MSTTELELNAFQRAFLAKDVEGMAEQLTDDVVLRSPIISTAFRGRREVTNLFAAILETFEDFRYGAVIRSGSTMFMEFHARVGRERIHGTDKVEFDADGRVREITVFIRPLRAVTALSQALGPAVVETRRKGLLVRELSRPLAAITRAADPLAARLVLGRVERR